MNRTFSLLFYPKKSKSLTDQTVPIYLRITIDGKRSEISSKRYIDVQKWNTAAQRLNGKSEEVKSVNEYLKTLERQVFDTHKTLMDDGKIVTAETLKNKLTGVVEKPLMLLSVFEQHNKDIEALIGNGYSKPTWVKYNTTKVHIVNFLKWKYKISDISLTDLNYQVLSDFEFYLKSQLKIGQNTTSKYSMNFKKVVSECVLKKWIVGDPFAEFKIKILPTAPTFLFDYELDAIERKEFKIQRLSQVRDLFVFSCYTGLSFIDVFKLTPGHIAIGIDGEKWIFTDRQKGGIPSHIPLLPAAIKIIAKYKDHPVTINTQKLLPVLSNQKMNAYLKEIADLCGIDKNLTYHVARHTFATSVTLSNDVPIESVSKMLGHTKLKTTQHYAKILDKKVSNDMKALREKFAPRLEIVKEDKAVS